MHTLRDTITDLRNICKRADLHFATWSPGDGMTRYRFYSKPDCNYFGDDGIYTALGLKDALSFARGYKAAKLGR